MILRRLLGLIAPDVAPQTPRRDPDLEQLKARAAELQARAASGCKGCTAYRRELQAVRHAILARELQANRPAALCGPAATTA